MTKEPSELLMAALVNIIKAAIKRGDWKVDGACDPDQVLKFSEIYLGTHGFVNGVDGHWQEHYEEIHNDKS